MKPQSSGDEIISKDREFDPDGDFIFERDGERLTVKYICTGWKSLV